MMDSYADLIAFHQGRCKAEHIIISRDLRELVLLTGVGASSPKGLS